MSKRRREADTNGAAAEAAELDTVFVDTNLGTHLAMLICSSDTASDFKKKVAMEHKKCFPEIGDIEVHSVKVKRRSNYYHLPDIMHVRSAFHGVKRNWFLSVDASNISTLLSNKNSMELGTSSGLNVGMTDVDDDCRGFVSDEKRNEIPLALTDGAAVKNAVSEMNSEPMVVKPVEKTTDSPAKKKRKVRHVEDASLEGGNAMFRPNGNDGKVSGVRNDQDDVEGRLVSEGTSLPSVAEKTNLGSILDSQNLNSSNRTNGDSRFEGMVDYGLGKDVHPVGAVSAAVPGSSARMMDVGGEGGDVDTAASKRKKKKKTVAKIQDTNDMEQIEKVETKKPHTETMRCEEKGETKKSHTEHDNDVTLPSDSNHPDNVGPDKAQKEASVMRDADAVVKPEISSSIKKKKKKREKKSVSTNIKNQGITEIHKGIGGSLDLPLPSGDHIPKETGKDESIRLNEGKDVEMKLLDASNHQEKVWEVNSREADLVETQTEQPLENVSVGNKMMTEKTKSSAHERHADFPTAETEHSIMESNQADKDKENTGKKKRRRKSMGTNKENLGIAEIQNGIKGSLDLPSPSGDHIPKATGKDENISLNDGKDVEMKLSDASNHEQEKFSEVNRKEADLGESQTLEDTSVRNKIMTEKTKSSAHERHADIPSAETEHSIMETNQVDEDKENTGKKKRRRKSMGTNKENLGIAEIQNGIKGSLDLPSPSGDHIPKATGKDESISLNEGKDVEMKLSDASNHEQEKFSEVNREEADLGESQTLEDTSVQNKIMTEKTKSSAHGRRADIPSVETDHSIMESNQADKDKENTGKKKRRRTMGTNKENLGIAGIQNGIKGSLDLPSPSGDHIPKATGKDESISLNEGKDVKMKLSEASNHEPEKVSEVNRKEADLMESQTLEDTSVRNQVMTEKTQSSASNGHAGLPTAETENTLTESNQADKDNGNTENKSKKSTKKRRKQKHTATDAQENLPVKDQQVGIEALATKETSVLANSELEGRYVDTSQVLSRRSEEKVDEMHELVLKSDGLAENSGKGDDCIDFKQYFVRDQLQNKVDSGDKVRKATKLKRSSTKVKDNDVPSVSIPTEVQNSIKSSENKDTVRSKFDSAHNSDGGEMSTNSFKRSSKTTKEKNESSLVVRNVSSYPSLDKSSSERSETLHNIRQSNGLLGRNVSNMMLMETPKKKIELATSGGIFQDNSGESSGDENGTMHSDHRTISPSDSSSMSGDSEGESELSQNSTSYGSNDAKAKPTSKIDSPESMELSLDVIAKGTRTFKKAIKVAEVEYVPETQL